MIPVLTSRLGRAAPLHREVFLAGFEGAALEHIQEFPQGREFPIPAFQHEGIPFLLDPELPVLEGSRRSRSLEERDRGRS